MIVTVREQCEGPFNVNLFCHQPAIANPIIESDWIERFRPAFQTFDAAPPSRLTEIYGSFVADDEMLAMLLRERPAVASFHFGLPDEGVIRALRSAGITLLASATSVVEARAIAAAGIDAVIAQGWEAGGHRGAFDPDAPDEQLTTAELVRRIVATINLPVIGAGGIMDGRDIATILDQGATAAQLGTAFVACDESLVDGGYRAALAHAAELGTVMTRVISGRPARGLCNRFTALGTDIVSHEIPAYPIAYDLGKALNAAAKAKGEYGFGAQWAGEGAPRSRAMSTAALVAALASELNEARRTK